MSYPGKSLLSESLGDDGDTSFSEYLQPEMVPIKLFEMITDFKSEADFAELESLLLLKFLKDFAPKSYDQLCKLFDKEVVSVASGGLSDSSSKRSSYSRQTRRSKSAFRDTVDDRVSVRTAASGRGTYQSVTASMYSFRVDQRVNINTKLIICANEIEALDKIMKKKEFKTKKNISTITIDLNALKISHSEIIETIDSFKDYVLMKGVDPITRKIPAERLLNFVKMWMKNGSTLIESMRLKTNTLKQVYVAKKNLLAVKSELSGILRPVDFEQLTIQKRYLNKQIEEKNTQLIGLKDLTGRMSLALATQKGVVMDSTKYLNLLKQKCDDADQKIKAIKKETIRAKAEIQQSKLNYETLSNLVINFRAPDAIEYAIRKQENRELDKILKQLKRVQYIGKLRLENMQRKLKEKQQQNKK